MVKYKKGRRNRHKRIYRKRTGCNLNITCPEYNNSRSNHAEIACRNAAGRPRSRQIKAGENHPDPRIQKDPPPPEGFAGDTSMLGEIRRCVTNPGSRGFPACNFNDRCRIKTQRTKPDEVRSHEEPEETDRDCDHYRTADLCGPDVLRNGRRKDLYVSDVQTSGGEDPGMD